MARTKTVLNVEQSAALSRLSEATRELYVFELDSERERQSRLAQLQIDQSRALRAARARNVPQRLLLPALGTTTPNRIYIIEARTAGETTSAPREVPVLTRWADALEVVPAQTDNVYRLRTTKPIPVYMWTYLQTAPDKYVQNLTVPTEPWEGWLEFAFGYPTSDKSDPVVNPLGAQWSYDGADLRAMLTAAGCYDPATNPAATPY